MPSHRARPAADRRTRWGALAVAALLLTALGTWAVLARPDATSRAAAPEPSSPAATTTGLSPSPTPSPPSPTSASPTAPPAPTAYPVGTFGVGRTSMTFVDTTRGTMARGPRAAVSTRTLLTTVRYPTPGPTGAAPACPCPVVVFAEGYNISGDRYGDLLDDLTSRGYLVAAPEFPLASSLYDGPASQADLDNEPGDVSFVLTNLLGLGGQPGPLSGLLDPGRVAVMGHSDGAAVAAVIGYDPTFRDRRFGAVVILSGQSGDVHSGPGLPDSPPALLAHGTADEFNPYPIGHELYAAIAPPHYLLTIDGGRHLEPFTTAPIRPAVSEVIAAFLDLELRGVSDAADRLAAAGGAPGLSLQSS